MPLPSPLRRGFTLVELLVVIAILAGLMAILIPAVQGARETARRMQCQGNLRQLAVACSNFAARQGAVPTLPHTGSGNRVGDPITSPSGGWLYHILPFVEQLPLFEVGTGLTGAALNTAISNRIATPVPLYVCPNRGSAVFDTPNVAFYFGNGGGMNPRPTKAARADYAGCWSGRNPGGWLGGGGGLDYYAYSGAERQVRSITDGLSNVFLCGERYLDPDQYRPPTAVNAECNNRGWSVGHEADVYSAVSEMAGPPYVPIPPLPDTPGLSRCDPDSRWAGTFGGPHNVACMAMVDGAVRTVAFDISPTIFMALGHMADGAGKAEDLE
jgi:prepilin-type N-terminal cleavage/methylation domain-containing protein